MIIQPPKTLSSSLYSGGKIVFLFSVVFMALAATAGFVLVSGTDQGLWDVAQSYEARELTTARALLPVADDGTQAAPASSTALNASGQTAAMQTFVQLAEAQALSQTTASATGSPTEGNVRATLVQLVSQENQEIPGNDRQDFGRWSMMVLVAVLAGAFILTYSLLARTRRQIDFLSRQGDVLLIRNELLEARLLERTQALEETRLRAEHERLRVEASLQDANHRIGNSLATVSSLLGLQVLRAVSEPAREALEVARTRVHAIASAHRRIKLGSDLEAASADEVLGAVIEDIQRTAAAGSRVTLASEIDPIVIGSRDAISLSILVSELVTNALKHGLTGSREGHVFVSLTRDERGVPILNVDDNGVGLSGKGVSEANGLGSVIIKQLSSQFGGEPRYLQTSEGGLRVSIPLPDVEKRPGPPPAV